MIYLFYGSDMTKARAKVRHLADSLIAKKPDAAMHRYTLEDFDVTQIDELVGGQGLFVSRRIIILDTLFIRAEFKESILNNLQSLADSENIFIILEGKLLKTELQAFEKCAEKIQECSLPLGITEKQKKIVSPFALADALGRRDKKMLWAEYLAQRATGSVAEELHGLLFWQVKTMLAAASAPSAAAANLKPFVYTKAKISAKNFSSDELRALSHNLVTIYHDAHRGLSSLDLLLEKLILEL